MKKMSRFIVILSILFPGIVGAQSCEPKFDYYKRGKDVIFYVNNMPINFPYYIWNFGDGSAPKFEREDFTSKSFTNTGTYYVCLRDSFCTTSPNQFCDSVQISSSTPVYADFSYTLEGNGKITLYNNASSSSAIKAYYWDLGDGTALDGENDSLVYQYKSSGTYSVCMYAFDQQKNYNYQCSTVTVFVPAPCYAEFTKPIANGSHYFLNQSVFPGSTATWLWNFGDSTTSTAKNPVKDYANAGTYEVSLTLNGPCNSKVTQTFTILDKKTCELKVSATNINQKATITIEDTANSLMFYDVDFGDGQILSTNQKIIEHIYPDTGFYTITVQNFHSLCGEIYGFGNVYINSAIPICNASFSAFPGDTSGNKAFIFSDSRINANANNKSYININWGDGTTEIDSTNKIYYQHEYDTAGIYTIRMIVSNQVNCADTSYRSIGVGPVYKVSGRLKQGNNPAMFSPVNAFMYEPQSGRLAYAYATMSNDSGFYEMFLRKGYYLIQTDFAFDPTSQDFYLPTYYGDKLNWTTSDVLTIVSDRNNIDINLIPFTPSNQNGGKIAGTAVYGKNVKDNGTAIPEGKAAEKMLIFLLDQNGKAISFTHTDANGKFEFNNMGAGNFRVWAEMPGKTTIAPYVYLAHQTATADKLKIVIGQNSVTAINEPESVIAMDQFVLYPNPATETITIQNKTGGPGMADIAIFDMMGKQMDLVIHKDKQNTSIAISSLKAGMYYVQIKDVNGHVMSKKLVKQEN